MKEDAVLFSGSSFCYVYVTEMAAVYSEAVVTADVATTTVSGSFFSCFAAAAVETASAKKIFIPSNHLLPLGASDCIYEKSCPRAAFFKS